MSHKMTKWQGQQQTAAGWQWSFEIQFGDPGDRPQQQGRTPGLILGRDYYKLELLSDPNIPPPALHTGGTSERISPSIAMLGRGKYICDSSEEKPTPGYKRNLLYPDQ